MHTAADITFDPAASGLAGIEVQAAMDDLAALVAGIDMRLTQGEADISALQAADTAFDTRLTTDEADLRGVFVRGWGNGAGNDPDAASRIARIVGGASGDSVGSYQADEFASHTHPVESAGGLRAATSGGGAPNNPGNSGPAGGNETRPKNVNLMYVIRTGL